MENTLQQAIEYRNNFIDAQIEKANKALQLAAFKKERFEELLASTNFAGIEAVCSKIKMKAEFRSINQSGNNEKIEDVAAKGLIIDFVLTPLDKCTIKPLTFSGYTSRGASKNDKKCQEKADKLEQIFVEATGHRFSVNKFCFETDTFITTDRPFSILVSMYTK